MICCVTMCTGEPSLLSRGVEARRLAYNGYGSAEPIASPGRPANNRVEIVFNYQ